MVTGGAETESQRSVEILSGNGTYLCTLISPLPLKTYFHTQSNGNTTVCGGAIDGTSDKCQSFMNGTWTISPPLYSDRSMAVSWKKPPTRGGPTLILGGKQNPTTAEMLLDGRFIPFDNNLTYPIERLDKIKLINIL